MNKYNELQYDEKTQKRLEKLQEYYCITMVIFLLCFLVIVAIDAAFFDGRFVCKDKTVQVNSKVYNEEFNKCMIDLSEKYSERVNNKFAGKVCKRVAAIKSSNRL